MQVWAEASTIYRSGQYSLKFSKSIQRQLVEVQKDFMPEDTEAGQIQGFLEHYTGNMVCSKQLFKEALGHTFDHEHSRDRLEAFLQSQDVRRVRQAKGLGM